MTLRATLLGAAAAVASASLASAADLPMEKAEAVEYVRICSEFGSGFFFIPGTDTCLRVSGELRADFVFRDRSRNIATSSDAIDLTEFAGRARLNFDARTATSLGTLRSFIRIQQSYNNAGPGNMTLAQGFLQLGGFTAGIARTTFLPVGVETRDIFGSVAAPYDADVPQFSYTARFGEGFFATLSVESKPLNNPGYALIGLPANVTVTEKGQALPDIVGTLGYASSSLSGSFSVAIHQNEVFDSNTTLVNPGDASSTGWAIGGALQYAAAPVTLNAWGAYADGAVKYINLTGGAVTDGVVTVVGPDLSISSNKAWKIGGTALFAASSEIDIVLGGAFYNFDSAQLVGEVANIRDFDGWNIHGNVVYKPVRGFDVAFSAGYNATNFKAVGVDDTDNWTAGVRVRRSF